MIDLQFLFFSNTTFSYIFILSIFIILHLVYISPFFIFLFIFVFLYMFFLIYIIFYSLQFEYLWFSLQLCTSFYLLLSSFFYNLCFDFFLYTYFFWKIICKYTETKKMMFHYIVMMTLSYFSIMLRISLGSYIFLLMNIIFYYTFIICKC